MGRPPVTAKGELLFRRQLEAALDWLEANGGSGGGGSPSWSSITGKPTTFPPEAHTHAIEDITGLSAELGAIPVAGVATVTVPNNRLEWSQTVTATGVTTLDRIVASIGAHVDGDENDAEMLDVMGLSATAGSGQITVTLAFAAPTAGPIKINWMAA